MEDPLGRLAREAGIVAGGRPSGDLPARPIRIIVLGERHRGDDSVSFAAARRAIVALDGAARELVELRETGQLDPADLVELPAGGAAIVVDAVVGIPPGSIVVLPLERLADLAAGRIERNGREAMPRSSRGDPPPGVLVGIGGARFDVGCDPSPAVAAATDAFAERIAAELASLVEALPGR
jgi:hydrogenase maturation protease